MQRQVSVRVAAALGDREYLTRLPKAVPAGRLLVHNHVRTTRRLGSRGFRAWLLPIEQRESVAHCACGWVPELGAHYRVRRDGGGR
jgi:hypothetical protein